MNTLTYIIGDPVDTLPPVIKSNSRDSWCACYQAAEQAGGLWVPIVMPDTSKARNLASVAKKRKRMEAETRGRTVFLRVVR